jgi:hypothetical protein
MTAPGFGQEADAQLSSIAALLAGLPCRWGFCGGWAIDLFLGRPTRPQKDVDLAVFRADQFTVRSHLASRGWALQKVVAGKALPWEPGELLRLPVHEIWCHQPAFFPSRLELLFNETDGANFRFRRDASIFLPLDRTVLPSDSGLPVLAPEIVLLYKAKAAASPHNAADFDSALPRLTAEARTWLGEALKKLHPGHPWLNFL